MTFKYSKINYDLSIYYFREKKRTSFFQVSETKKLLTNSNINLLKELIFFFHKGKFHDRFLSTTQNIQDNQETNNFLLGAV